MNSQRKIRILTKLAQDPKSGDGMTVEFKKPKVPMGDFKKVRDLARQGIQYSRQSGVDSTKSVNAQRARLKKSEGTIDLSKLQDPMGGGGFKFNPKKIKAN